MSNEATAATQKPLPPKVTIGRVVRYVLTEKERLSGFEKSDNLILGAFVSAVHDQSNVSLQVYGNPVVSWHASVVYDETKQPGTWHWPERE